MSNFVIFSSEKLYFSTSPSPLQNLKLSLEKSFLVTIKHFWWYSLLGTPLKNLNAFLFPQLIYQFSYIFLLSQKYCVIRHIVNHCLKWSTHPTCSMIKYIAGETNVVIRMTAFCEKKKQSDIWPPPISDTLLSPLYIFVS